MARQNPRKSNFPTRWKCSLISFLVPLHRLSKLNEESVITPKRVELRLQSKAGRAPAAFGRVLWRLLCLKIWFSAVASGLSLLYHLLFIFHYSSSLSDVKTKKTKQVNKQKWPQL